VTAREPLVAFNVQLDTPDPEVARAVATGLREAGGGLSGVRALGLPREVGGCQVSVNVHDPIGVPLAEVVTEIKRLAAEHGARAVEAELVGLAPAAALEGYPDDPPIRDFDPKRDVIENVLG
jgi:glutamate formiminotransferase